MNLQSILSKPFARLIASVTRKWSMNPFETQKKVFDSLITSGRSTSFGKEHLFDKIKTYEDFKQQVPIRDYEGIRPYIERIIAGENDVLWKGKPIYFAKTSGTTSGTKYIPITKDSIDNHISSARNAILLYIAEKGNAEFVDGRMIFLSGSPILEKVGGIATGRLSGIVNHHIPSYLRSNQSPTYKTNCIEDWEDKLAAIVNETATKNLTLISGIPPWVQMYFDKLENQTGKKIKDIFPQFNLFIYGGVNYEPYRHKIEASIGRKVDSIELYPASEGFIAYQDRQNMEGLLLILNSGIFYEFIPADEFYNENPSRISLKDVQLGINYVLIINNNAGLWGYNIGDTVKFISTLPYRIIVTGRISHFTSAFGEHVIAEEVEYALKVATEGTPIQVTEFTVAPQVNPAEGKPYHEWLVEFSTPPENMEEFASVIDKALQHKNSYYKDLIVGNILRPLIIRSLTKDSFINYMRSKGKLGGQNKVPRIANDRNIANDLLT